MHTQKLLPALPEYSFESTLVERARDDLYRSNNALSQIELTDIRSRITEVSSIMAEFKAGIDELRNRLSEYEQGHDKCAAFIQDHQPFLSSVRSVPPEIWRQVFIFAQINHERSGYDLPFNRNAPQLRSYGAVSSLWRRVALDTPALWSNIRISGCYDRSTKETDIFPSTALLLGLWLTRSKYHPLKIVIDATSLDEISLERLRNIRSLLNGQAHRWRELRIAGDWDFIQDWPAIIKPTSLLEECAFDLSTDNSYRMESPSVEDVSFVTDAPKLRNVRIDQLQLYEFPDLPSLVPWSSIKSLEIGDGCFSYTELDQSLFLKRCPSLEEFNVCFAREEDDDDLEDYEPIKHENLKSLYISGPPRLLCFLTAPHLSSLQVNSFSKADRAASVANFIQRSPCLKALTISGGHDVIVTLLHGSGVTQINTLKLTGDCAEWNSVASALFSLCEERILTDLEALRVEVGCRKFWGNKVKANAAISIRDAILTLYHARVSAALEGYSAPSMVPHMKHISVDFSVSKYDLDRNKFKVELEAFKGLRDMALQGLSVDITIT